MYNFIQMNIAHLLRDSFRDKSKVHFIGDLTDDNTLFVGLTETFLNSNILDSEILMEGFNIVRCDTDRSERMGGGVCFYLKQSINHKTLLSYCNSTCEVLIVKLSEPDVVLVLIYRPPNATAASFNDIIQRTEETIRALESPLPEVMMLGDFNFPDVLWDSTISEQNVHLSSLVKLRDFLYLDQVIKDPTRKSNTLDLLFRNESIIKSIETNETVISDHNIIHVFTELRTFDNSTSQAMNPPGSMFEQINYFKADWNTIVQEISSSKLENSIQHLNTEDALNLLAKTVSDVCARNAPTKKCKNKKISLFFKHRKVLMRKRRKLTNKISKHGVICRERIKEQLVNIELEILQSHKDENIHLENVAVHRIKTDPNYFFKYAKKFAKCNTEVGPLLNTSGDLVKDKKSMSNMLLKQFSSVFSSPSINYMIKEPTSFFYDHDESNSSMRPELTDITFTKDIVESTIKNLKTNSAPGPDGMT